MRTHSAIALWLLLAGWAGTAAGMPPEQADDAENASGSLYPAEPCNFDSIVALAEELASRPYAGAEPVAPPFRQLDYDGYRLIAARPETALWRREGLPFWAEFFAAGFLYHQPVEVYVVDDGRVERLEYGDRWFQFRGDARPLQHTPGGGFAGLRLLTQFPMYEHMSEFFVFLGSSYFRGIGAGQHYGTSCRGLAIDIGLATAEEFPRFSRFWLVKPADEAKQVRVWALLDSAGVAGAYEFVIVPGSTTVVDVEARLFLRHGIQRLAFAPLTSMWMWDQRQAEPADPRPEVHDADSLLIHHGADHWTYRGLQRPAAPQVQSWPVQELHGFGLLQRDRTAAHYADSEAHYDRRPSVWVTPLNDWGPGRVELLELPAEHEGMDNIGAYWLSDRKSDTGPYRPLRYRIAIGERPVPGGRVGRVVESRWDEQGDGSVAFEIEFESLPASPAEAVLEPAVESSAGAVRGAALFESAEERPVLRFEFLPAADASSAVIEARIVSDRRTETEKWSYRWTDQ